METQADTIIGADVNVKGNLKNKGSIQINGTVEGEIKSDENITVGESAIVTGPIAAKNVLISGKANGTIDASEKLEIDPTGVVDGEIKAKTLIVREGAVFNGNCVMASDIKAEPVATTKDESEKDVKEEKKEQIKTSFWDKGKSKEN
jgi:cytoskeletal protein CcmA (bactofilin family)